MAQPGPNSGWTELAHRVGPILPPLAVEDNPSWKDLIKLKYGLEEGGWFSAKPKGSFGVGL